MENAYFPVPSWKTRIFWVLCCFRELGPRAFRDLACLQENGGIGEGMTAGFCLSLQHYSYLVLWLIRKPGANVPCCRRRKNHAVSGCSLYYEVGVTSDFSRYFFPSHRSHISPWNCVFVHISDCSLNVNLILSSSIFNVENWVEKLKRSSVQKC